MSGPPGRGRALTAPDLLGAARAGYGGLLLGAPRRMIGVCAAGPAGRRAAGVARVLGARHLLQAALTAAVLSARVPPDEIAPGTALLAGSAVDTAHAASMIGLALARRPLHRAALADGLLAASFAAFGMLIARRAGAGHAAGRGSDAGRAGGRHRMANASAPPRQARPMTIHVT